MESLIAGLDAKTQRMGPILDDLKTAMQNIAELSARFNAYSGDIPEIARSLQEALASAEVILKDLGQTTPQLPKIVKNIGNATDSLPVFVLQVQQVMVELERLIKQLQSSWLLGGKTAENHPPNERISPLEVRP